MTYAKFPWTIAPDWTVNALYAVTGNRALLSLQLRDSYVTA